MIGLPLFFAITVLGCVIYCIRRSRRNAASARHAHRPEVDYLEDGKGSDAGEAIQNVHVFPVEIPSPLADPPLLGPPSVSLPHTRRYPEPVGHTVTLSNASIRKSTKNEQEAGSEISERQLDGRDPSILSPKVTYPPSIHSEFTSGRN